MIKIFLKRKKVNTSEKTTEELKKFIYLKSVFFDYVEGLNLKDME